MRRIEMTAEFVGWYATLSEQASDAVDAAVTVLARVGPVLGRPLVDRVNGSRHHNMKELRASAGGRRLRVLFAFDPRGAAILLLGGDKTGQWRRWYATAIPLADDRYDAYLAALRDEGILP